MDSTTTLIAVLAVVLLSAASFIGAAFFALKQTTIDKLKQSLIALSVGSLLGGSFLHLIPHLAEDDAMDMTGSLIILAGYVSMFAVEKMVHYYHCTRTCDKCNCKSEELPHGNCHMDCHTSTHNSKDVQLHEVVLSKSSTEPADTITPSTDDSCVKTTTTTIPEASVITHQDHNHAKTETKPFVWMILFGDGVHNLFDGAAIAAAFAGGCTLGWTVFFVSLLHELPQELGDFGALLEGGLCRWKALLYNFLSGCSAVIGCLLTLLLNDALEGIDKYVLAFAIGTYLYIAASDLVPLLHNEVALSSAFKQTLIIVFAIAIMAITASLEHEHEHEE